MFLTASKSWSLISLGLVSAFLSQSVVAAIVAGGFGLAGTFLQIRSYRHTRRATRTVDRANARAADAHTQSRENSLRLDRTEREFNLMMELANERGEEIKRLNRRVEQLMFLLRQRGLDRRSE